jgi:fluoroacetyl-CoA thioesterase
MKKRSNRKPPKRKRAKPAVEQSSQPPLPSIGLEAVFEKIIPHEWTIQAYDPRLPPVLSTPAMIGMMEIAATLAVQPELPPGAITVGTRIEVDHLKAVPSGTAVIATARLVKHKGRFMVFAVEAHAGDINIGRGHVYRAIVEPANFQAKARSHSPA